MNNKLHRRSFFKRIAVASGAFFLPSIHAFKSEDHTNLDSDRMPNPLHPILSLKPMGFQWETLDPFLFCVHHEDQFPNGNDWLGPEPTHFKGRNLGDDFIVKDGFRMYHGRTVPGFPGHPHRGFETITLVRKGWVDHADSMGAAGRYGNGDVQWMTAGKGVQHSEMFPLLNKNSANPLELFQIWINLPAKNKMVPPHFTMLWREDIPVFNHKDQNNRGTMVEVIAGQLAGHKPPSPPPNSWAFSPENEVAVWNIKMEPGAMFTLPPASHGTNRMLYAYAGKSLTLDGKSVPEYHSMQLHSTMPAQITAAQSGNSLLLLQGKPIAEQVIQYGPFVMNTKQEINQAFEDFHRTKFGGWPWERYDQVHPAHFKRFAKHTNGKEENRPF
jgi:redox-sensitive bicupin YhaK (pirin superfamily)